MPRIRLLLIDDAPALRPRMIEEVLKRMGADLEGMGLDVDPIPDVETQNDSGAIEKRLREDYGLIFLDWTFPLPGPQGGDTLTLLRKLGYEGPILIFSAGWGQLSEYIEPGVLADDYFLERTGDDELAGKIKALLTRPKIEEKRGQLPQITLTHNTPSLSYYSGIDSMEDAGCFYHPATHIEEKNSDKAKRLKAKARKLVCLASAEWNRDDHGKITSTGTMGKVIEQIESLANTDIPVLILGETGTGKELVAKLLHYHPSNKEKKRHNFPEEDDGKELYIALNCGGFSKSTLNVELFGSVKGAFTDAVDKAGVFEQVTIYSRSKGRRETEAGGTVFLDELGLMPLSTQAYFLRVLEEKAVRRMGSDQSKSQEYQGKIPVDFRIVAATNEDLPEMVRKGKFRLDLFYRIALAKIRLPALRNRSIEDFSLLVQYFLCSYNNQYQRQLFLSNEDGYLIEPSSDLIIYLWSRYPWKGNVRELQGLVHAMVAFSEPERSEPLSLKDLPEDIW